MSMHWKISALITISDRNPPPSVSRLHGEVSDTSQGFLKQVRRRAHYDDLNARPENCVPSALFLSRGKNKPIFRKGGASSLNVLDKSGNSEGAVC